MANFLKKANFGGSNGSHFFIELYYDLLSQDKDKNQSKVKYYLYLGSTDGYSGSGSSAVECYINDAWVGNTTSIAKNDYKLIGTKEETITHDSSGKKSPGYSASASSNWTGINSASLSGTYTLPDIPRNFTSTPTTTIKEYTTTSVTIEWSTSETCDLVRYYLDGSSDYVEVFSGSSKMGTFTINDLDPSTSHTIYISCRRKDSGMWKNSEELSFETSGKTISIKKDGEWKTATPYIKVNGEWKVAVPYIKINGTWKEGI